MRGLSWARHYFPAAFFQGQVVDEDERTLDLPSHAAPRAERCLWLGVKIASVIHRDFILIAKQRGDLLQWLALSIGEEDQQTHRGKHARDDEREVEFPPDVLEGRRCRLQPHDVDERNDREAQTYALGADVRGEELAEVGEMRAVEEEAVHGAEDEAYRDRGLQGGGVGRALVGGQERSLDRQHDRAAEDAEGKEFGAWEAVDQEHGHGVDDNTHYEPGGREEELFDRAVAELSVECWAVV
jgi:hypothetical protein